MHAKRRGSAGAATAAVTVLACAGILGSAVVGPAQAGSLISSTARPSVNLDGVLMVLSDESTTVSHVLRLTDNTVVPLGGDAIEGIRPGSTVHARVAVPNVVVQAARDGSTAPTRGGRTMRLRQTDLGQAAGAGASQDSPIGQASIAESYRTGTPLATAQVEVVSQPTPARLSSSSTPSSDASAGSGSSAGSDSSVGTDSVSSLATVHSPSVAASFAPGVHDLTIVLGRFPNSGAPANTVAAVTAQTAAASSYWSDQSHGDITLRVAKTVPLTFSATTCNAPWQMWTEAALASGFQADPNQHLVLSLPPGSGCAYGLASIGQDVNAGGYVYVSDTAWPVLAHEVGHNLGLEHANFLHCSAPDADLVALPSGCRVDEYGDAFDVMAMSAQTSAGSLSTPQAFQAGMLSSSEYIDVDHRTVSVTLAPVSSYAGVRSARVTDPRTGEVYFVEYRRRTGRDQALYQNLQPGVRVVRVEQANVGTVSTVALDPSPLSATYGGADLARIVPAGDAFTSYSGGVVVSVNSVTEAFARVTIASLVAQSSLKGVLATPPTFRDACGADHDELVIPSTDGIEYSVNGTPAVAGPSPSPGSGSVTVSATATGADQIIGSDTWTGSFSSADCTAKVTAPAYQATGAIRALAPVSWSAQAPRGAGSLTYDTRVAKVDVDAQGRPTTPEPTAWLTGTSATSAVLSLAYGGVYRVSVRVRDAFGTVGPWSSPATVTMSLDERAAGSTWSGTWTSITSGSAFGRTLRSTRAKRATWSRQAVYTNGIVLYGVKHPRGSKAALYVDGRYRGTFDTWARTGRARAVLATLTLPWGLHRVEVVNLATARRPILTVDAIGYRR